MLVKRKCVCSRMTQLISIGWRKFHEITRLRKVRWKFGGTKEGVEGIRVGEARERVLRDTIGKKRKRVKSAVRRGKSACRNEKGETDRQRGRGMGVPQKMGTMGVREIITLSLCTCLSVFFFFKVFWFSFTEDLILTKK